MAQQLLLCPLSPHLLYRQSLLLIKCQKFTEAFILTKSLVSLGPQAQESWMKLAELAVKISNFKFALVILNTASTKIRGSETKSGGDSGGSSLLAEAERPTALLDEIMDHEKRYKQLNIPKEYCLINQFVDVLLLNAQPNILRLKVQGSDSGALDAETQETLSELTSAFQVKLNAAEIKLLQMICQVQQ